MPRKHEKDLTDEEIQQYRDQRPCRHGSRLWCESCVTETYVLHTAISKQQTLEGVAAHLQQEAGKAFVDDKYDTAELLKRLSKFFGAQASEAATEARKIRKAQGIG